ncbi:MAG: DUF2125 domain-containing protein [bacterium]
MRGLLWAVLALGVLWGGYWVAGSQAIERGVDQWFTDQAASGITATEAGISVSGFADRFDLTVTNPHLADPATGWGWQAPFAQVFAMTWKPWHVIAALPHDQVIEAPDQRISLKSSRLTGSLRVQPSTDGTLEEVVVEGHDLLANSDLGWTIGAKSLVAAIARDATRQFGQHLGLEVTDLVPDPSLGNLVPELGPVISSVHLDATLVLTAPIDRHMADTLPALHSIILTDFHAIWGASSLSASGTIKRADDGHAEGIIEVRVKSWRVVPKLFVAAGLIRPEMGDTIERGLETLAADGPDRNELTLPLTLADGWMSLGPLPLGPAPML